MSVLLLTEDVYATVATAGEEDVERAVTAAHNAVERDSEWRELDPHERVEYLAAFTDALEAMRDEIGSSNHTITERRRSVATNKVDTVGSKAEKRFTSTRKSKT